MVKPVLGFDEFFITRGAAKYFDKGYRIYIFFEKDIANYPLPNYSCKYFLNNLELSLKIFSQKKNNNKRN